MVAKPPPRGLPQIGVARPGAAPVPQKPPIVVGAARGRPTDPRISKYTADLAQRAKAAGDAGRVPIPDLGMAAANFRPEKDGPMTLGEMAQSQENIRNMSNGTSGEQPKKMLSEATMGGLRALHEAVAAPQREAQARIEGQTPPPPVEEPKAPPGEKKSVTKMSDEEKAKLSEMSDLDYDLLMSRVRSDVINNSEERKAVEARLKPMDIADGIMSGEFKQTVEIVPGKLVIGFRTITPFENEQIRRHILTEIMADEKYSQIHTDRYGFMQCVATIHTMNGKEMPAHLKTTGPNTREFIWEVFLKKFEMFNNLPGPFIHSLSVHSNWFDLRVRELFTSASLKNG